MLWHIELKLYMTLFNVQKIKFECHNSVYVWLSVRLSIFCIFLLHTSRYVVYLRQFFKELCPFWNLEYYKYEVFRNFLLHALTYWGEILHMILFYCTSDQARVASICVKFCWSYAFFGTLNTENTQFSALFSYTLWHIELKFCIWLCFTVLQIKFECL